MLYFPQFLVQYFRKALTAPVVCVFFEHGKMRRKVMTEHYVCACINTGTIK